MKIASSGMLCHVINCILTKLLWWWWLPPSSWWSLMMEAANSCEHPVNFDGTSQKIVLSSLLSVMNWLSRQFSPGSSNIRQSPKLNRTCETSVMPTRCSWTVWICLEMSVDLATASSLPATRGPVSRPWFLRTQQLTWFPRLFILDRTYKTTECHAHCGGSCGSELRYPNYNSWIKGRSCIVS